MSISYENPDAYVPHVRPVSLELQGTRLILNLRRAGGRGTPTPILQVSDSPMEFATNPGTATHDSVDQNEIELAVLSVAPSGTQPRESFHNDSVS